MAKKDLDLIKERYAKASEYWNSYYKEAEKLEELYWGDPHPGDDSQDKWRSQVVDNVAFEVVEKTVSHLFGGDPKGRFIGVEPGDDLGAIVTQALFDYQWNYPGQNMKRKLRDMGLQMAIMGIGFGILDWKYETRVRKRVEVIDENTTEEIEEEIVVWDCPYFKPLYLYDCYPDPAATSIEEMQWFIYDEYMTLDELKNANKGTIKPYKNLNKVEEKLKEKDASERDHGSVDSLRKLGSGGKKERLKVRRMVTRSKRISYLPDVGEEIENRDNPYNHGDLNIHLIVDYSYPNQLFGRGEIEPIKTQQLGLTSTLNQRLDNVELVLNSGFKAKAGSKYSHTWKMRPGWVAQVEDMKDLEPFVIPDVTGDTFIQTTNYFKDSITRVLGHVDFTTRNETTTEKTATEVRTSAGEQNARLKDKEKYIDEFMTRLANQWRELNEQFVTSEKLIRIVGVDAQRFLAEKQAALEEEELSMGYQQGQGVGYMTISPELLEGKYDYIVTGGSLTEVDPLSKVNAIKMGMEALAQANESLRMNGKKVDLEPLIERMLRELDIKNLDEIIVPMTEQETTQMQMAMQPSRPVRLPPSTF